MSPIRRLKRSLRGPVAWWLALSALLAVGHARAEVAADAEEIAALSQKLAAQPEDFEARLQLANALLARQRFAAVVEVLQSAPMDERVVLLRAKAWLWSGQAKRAESAIMEAPEAIRDSVDVSVCLARVLLALGEPAKARDAVAVALARAPDHGEGRNAKLEAVRALATAGAPGDPQRLGYASEWAALETDASRKTEAVRVVGDELDRLPAAERERAVAVVEVHWPRELDRELFLIERERKFQAFEAAYRRALAARVTPAGAQAVAPLLPDLACAAAWGALAKREPRKAKELAERLAPSQRPACLSMALADAQMNLQNYDAALEIYTALARRDPANKDLVLGTARAALSSNRLDVAGRALARAETMKGVSRRELDELKLGLHIRAANAALQGFRTEEAKREAQKALKLNPKSIDGALLLSVALQIEQQPEAAARVLTSAIARTPADPRLLAALARLPGEHDHVALARKALQNSAGVDPALKFDLDLALGDALVQADRLEEAAEVYSRVAKAHPKRQEPLLRLAQVSMRQGDYFQARELILEAHAFGPTFDSTLSLADVNHALGLDSTALDLGAHSVALKPAQPDAVRFVDRLQFKHAPNAGGNVYHSWDNGTNRAWQTSAFAEADVADDLRARADAGLRRVETRVTGEEASVAAFGAGARHALSARVSLAATAGFALLHPKGARSAVLPIGEARGDFRIGTSHRASFGYQADTFAYTAGMVGDHLGTHAFVATGNGPIYRALWFYTSVSGTFLTDGNERGIVFGSLYSQLLANPGVKIGLNGQLLGFSETSIRSYFSPSRLMNTEVFAELLKDGPEERLVYGALAAGGLQRIEELDMQTTYRLSALVGGRPLRQLRLVLKAERSTSANVEVAGFKYSQVGGQLDWTFH